MSSFFGIESSSASSFFSSSFGVSTSSGSSSSMLSSLSDYGMIQSGAYKKLLKKYYTENPPEKSGTTSSTNTIKSSAASDTVKNLLAVKNSASDTTTAAKELTGLDLEETNKESLTKSVQGFVTEYNNTLTNLDNLDSVTILQTGVWMTNQTKANKNVLADVGISIGSDNKLTIDTKKLESATNAQLSAAFEGSSSAVGQIAKKASAITTMAGQQALYNERAGSYSSSGGYNHLTTSQLFNSIT